LRLEIKTKLRAGKKPCAELAVERQVAFDPHIRKAAVEREGWRVNENGRR